MVDRFQSPCEALKFYLSWLAAKLDALPSRSRDKNLTDNCAVETVKHLKSGGDLLYYGGPGYPGGLEDLGEPPPVLFVKGKLSLVPFAAVVGARDICSDAARITDLVVKALADRGFSIISGGAAGVDSVAHKAALANGVESVAVLGCGVDVVYPETNALLFEELRKHGGLVSELLPSAPPMRSFFPTRNRIVAGVAEIIVVIQAGRKSGSLITANWGKRLNRRVFVVEPPYDDPCWEGNRTLLDSGSLPLSATDPGRDFPVKI